MVSPPEGAKVGWDAADALAEGWNGARAGKLVAAAEPFKQKAATKDDGDGCRRRSRKRSPAANAAA